LGGVARTLDITVPTSPIITDGDPTIAAAVRAVWPAQLGVALPVPLVARCKNNLRLNDLEAMERDLIDGWAHTMRRRLDAAFLRLQG
jgi:hypothetical protein